jgi:hypothetical protein
VAPKVAWQKWAIGPLICIFNACYICDHYLAV